MFIALVNWDKCSGCGDCVRACPMDCFEMTAVGKPEIPRSTFCIDCSNCKEVCKENAIIVSMQWGGYQASKARS